MTPGAATVQARATFVHAAWDRRRVDLTPGVTVRWLGGLYEVAALQGPRVHLRALDEKGEDAVALVSAVTCAADFTLVEAQGRERPGPQIPDVSIVDVLDPLERERMRTWEWHLHEIVHGLPPGAPSGARPRPQYDPEETSRWSRLDAKSRELKDLGWTKVSVATLRRRALDYEERGVAGLVKVVAGDLYGDTDERIVQLLLEELRAGTEESSGWANRLRERVEARLRTEFPKEGLKLSRTGFYRLLKNLGVRVEALRGPVRRREERASSPEPPWSPTRATMLGEVVQIDSTGLDILAVGDHGYPVQVELTAAIDVASRSIIAAMIVPRAPGRSYKGKRLGGRATTSFDATLMLAQALAPMPGRPGWSPSAAADKARHLPYADLVACDPRMVGAAARPVIRPKMVVVDQGNIYQSEHFTDVCTSLKISVRSARDRTADDKAVIESTFSAIKKLFCQYVAGYTARDLSRRGKFVTDGVMWRLNELQDLLNEWIALGWQQHRHEGLRDPHLPGVVLTPNQMYAALVACEGYVPLPLSESENRKLLLREWRPVTDKGVRIGNRTYDSRALQEYNKEPSGIRGKGMKWPIRHDPYSPRYVWLFDQRKEQRGEDPWVEAEFVHQDLIGDDWSLFLWETAERLRLEAGGSEEDRQWERDIALEVSELRQRARQGPADEPATPTRRGRGRTRQRRPAAPYTGPGLAVRAPAADRYAGIPVPDPARVRPARPLNVPAHLLFASAALAGPEPSPPASPTPAGTNSVGTPPPGADTDAALPRPAKEPDPRRWRSRTFPGRATDLFLRSLAPPPDDSQSPKPSSDEEIA